MRSDFALTRQQCRLQVAARDFAHDVLGEAGQVAHDVSTPRERFVATRPVYEQVVEAGYLRRILPPSIGGELRSMVDLAVIAEEFTAVDVNVPLTLFAVSLGLAPLALAGSAVQRRKYLPPFLTAAGAPLAAFAFSEPGGTANFDAPAPGEGVRTNARLDGEEWVINGAKTWVSNSAGWDGHGPDITCVVCRTEPAAPTSAALSVLLVPGPIAGLAVDDTRETMGHRAHLTPTVTYTDVRVPSDSLLGEPGQGTVIIGSGFTGACALVGAFSLALMRSAYEFALDFARTEHRGGTAPILDHQSVGFALADVKTRLEAVRALTWRTCQAIDADAAEAPELALHTKIFASEAAVSTITRLIGVVGVDSYSHDLPLAGLLQDALAYPLFGGSNNGVRRRQLHAML